MKAVIQRVSSAQCTVDGTSTGEIGHGIVLLLGVHHDDNEEQAKKLAQKIINLRFFNDAGGKLNLSLRDIGGEVLVISQFTLFGDCSKGRRPSYSDAAPPEKAEALYEYFIEQLKLHDVPVATGVFGAMMSIALTNEGPVTLIVDM